MAPSTTLLHSNTPLREIGHGFCGTVWTDADEESDVVLKREDGAPGRSLVHESHMQRHIISTMATKMYSTLATERGINIPTWQRFLTPESTAWQHILPRLPPGFERCNALVSEKIQPFPGPVREAIVQRYCPGLPRTSIEQNGANQHCLLRPYLGRRRRMTSPDRPLPRSFSLCNYPLHLDQMENLNLSPDTYATAMAEALAFLHWSAQVDAGDVEFVLARPRSGTSHAFTSDVLGPHVLWVLDFDCCRDMGMNRDGIQQAARCFWRNDPYYPRPCNPSLLGYNLWVLFKDRFLTASEEILDIEGRENDRHLPGLLIEEIVRTQGKYAKG